MADTTNKITLMFEMQESIENMKKLGYNAISTIVLMRLIDCMVSAKMVHTDYAERMDVYDKILSTVYGDEYLAMKKEASQKEM